MDAMVLSVLYVWCQINKDQIVTFWFGTRFKVRYDLISIGITAFERLVYFFRTHRHLRMFNDTLLHFYTFPFQAMYLPWVLAAFNMIIMGRYVNLCNFCCPKAPPKNSCFHERANPIT